MSQPTLWSAGARDPEITDLEGLLAGPGHVVVRGDTARIGVVCSQERANRLAGLLADELGIAAELGPVTGEEGLAVRTPWLAELRPVAARWQPAALLRPPPGLVLDGPRLRWWCIAAGASSEAGYALPLSPTAEPAWAGVGAALSAAGIAGVLVGPRAGGPAYRIVGQRRLRHLRELVGDPPAGVPQSDWPPQAPH